MGNDYGGQQWRGGHLYLHTLDSSGKAHISYYDETNFHPKYANNTIGAWVITTVDSTGEAGRHTSIAVDTFGKAHQLS